MKKLNVLDREPVFIRGLAERGFRVELKKDSCLVYLAEGGDSSYCGSYPNANIAFHCLCGLR